MGMSFKIIGRKIELQIGIVVDSFSIIGQGLYAYTQSDHTHILNHSDSTCEKGPIP